MDINLLFKIAAIRNFSSSTTSSVSKSRKRRSSNDDNAGRINYCSYHGNKRNQFTF